MLIYTIACVTPHYGDNCKQICECGPGGDTCDPVRGCLCLSEWTGVHCDQDVNECEVYPTICDTDEKCQNLQGSYTCNCREGFQKIEGTCSGKF